MSVLALIGLFLFVLEAVSKFSLVILAIVAVKFCNHFIPSRPVILPRLWGASKAAYKEIFHPNGSSKR